LHRRLQVVLFWRTHRTKKRMVLLMTYSSSYSCCCWCLLVSRHPKYWLLLLYLLVTRIVALIPIVNVVLNTYPWLLLASNCCKAICVSMLFDITCRFSELLKIRWLQGWSNWQLVVVSIILLIVFITVTATCSTTLSC